MCAWPVSGARWHAAQRCKGRECQGQAQCHRKPNSQLLPLDAAAGYGPAAASQWVTCQTRLWRCGMCLGHPTPFVRFPSPAVRACGRHTPGPAGRRRGSAATDAAVPSTSWCSLCSRSISIRCADTRGGLVKFHIARCLLGGVGLPVAGVSTPTGGTKLLDTTGDVFGPTARSAPSGNHMLLPPKPRRHQPAAPHAGRAPQCTSNACARNCAL